MKWSDADRPRHARPRRRAGSGQPAPAISRRAADLVPCRSAFRRASTCARSGRPARGALTCVTHACWRTPSSRSPRSRPPARLVLVYCHPRQPTAPGYRQHYRRRVGRDGCSRAGLHARRGDCAARGGWRGWAGHESLQRSTFHLDRTGNELRHHCVAVINADSGHCYPPTRLRRGASLRPSAREPPCADDVLALSDRDPPTQASRLPSARGPTVLRVARLPRRGWRSRSPMAPTPDGVLLPLRYSRAGYCHTEETNLQYVDQVALRS